MKKNQHIFYIVIILLIACAYPLLSNDLLVKKRRETIMNDKKVEKTNIREPAVAGSFYPANPIKLSQQIQEFLEAVPSKKIDGEIIALVTPHAGYIYSGQVAAYAYKLLCEKVYPIVLIIAPSHRVYFHGASIYSKGAFKTPLGLVSVDNELCEKIMSSSSSISFYPQAHIQEHSLEVQLPFLQSVLKEFKLIPIVMGDQSLDNCKTLSDAIFQVIKGKKILLIASSDLSHYYPYEKAVKLDNLVIEKIKNFDVEGLAKDFAEGKSEACGGGPIITVMLLAKKMGANKSIILKYENSGDVTGDKSGVVGYLSAIFLKEVKSGNKNGNSKKIGIDLGLSEEEKKFLHYIAKTSIEAKLLGKTPPAIDPTNVSENLRIKRGAFVTLHKHGILRGCIGYIQPYKPLYQTVSEMAIAAAFEDRRFPPLKKEELDDLEIEISVLTPLKKISDIDEINIGRDGLYVIKGFQSGLLLPQVATEYGWDRETFLEHTCLKAGLDKEAWKDKDTEIYIFSADIF